MDENLNHPKLTIHDLPNDVLYEILKWTADDDLENVQQVCSLWHAIIDEWIGRAVCASRFIPETQL